MQSNLHPVSIDRHYSVPASRRKMQHRRHAKAYHACDVAYVQFCTQATDSPRKSERPRTEEAGIRMEGIQERKLPRAQGTLMADPRHFNLPRPFWRSTGWLMASRGTLRQ
jgi:hypothetical protein